MIRQDRLMYTVDNNHVLYFLVNDNLLAGIKDCQHLTLGSYIPATVVNELIQPWLEGVVSIIIEKHFQGKVKAFPMDNIDNCEWFKC